MIAGEPSVFAWSAPNFPAGDTTGNMQRRYALEGIRLVTLPRAHFKLAAILLICGAAIACTCGALDVDIGHLVRGLLRVVGVRSAEHSSQLVREIIVSAGNELTIAGGTQTITHVSPDELVQRLAWAGMYQKDGWLAFRGQSLESVVAEFNRHNRRKLIIADPQTARLQVGGKFRVTDLDGFVAALGLTHGVRATLSGTGGAGVGDVITLSGGNSDSSKDSGQRDVHPPVP
jgi:hypothetical protein